MQVYLAPKEVPRQANAPWQRVAGNIRSLKLSAWSKDIRRAQDFRINRSKSLTWKVWKGRPRGQNLHKAVKEPELKPRLPTSTRTVFCGDVMRLSHAESANLRPWESRKGGPWQLQGDNPVISPLLPLTMWDDVHGPGTFRTDRVEKQSQEAPWCPSIIYPEPTSQHASPKIDKDQWRKVGSGVSRSPLQT